MRTAPSPRGPALTLLGGALIVVGVFLPWFSVTGVLEIIGIDRYGQGKVWLVLGIVIAAAGLIMLAKRSRGIMLGLGITALVMSMFAVFAALGEITSVRHGISVGEDSYRFPIYSPGIGLWVVLLGAFLGVVGAIMSIVTKAPATAAGTGAPYAGTPSPPAGPGGTAG